MNIFQPKFFTGFLRDTHIGHNHGGLTILCQAERQKVSGASYAVCPIFLELFAIVVLACFCVLLGIYAHFWHFFACFLGCFRRIFPCIVIYSVQKMAFSLAFCNSDALYDITIFYGERILLMHI